MNLRGRRIHIMGSADPQGDEAKLIYGQRLISELVTALSVKGALFVIPFGKEPRQKDRDGPAIIFDWTVAEAVHCALVNGKALPSGANGQLIFTLATSKTDAQIPGERRHIFEDLRKRDAISMEFLNPGWTSGAYRRQRLAQVGDILIGVSGGEGVEHLAVEYSSRGKPVIPLDLNIGSASHDGSGGASRLFFRALSDPSDFFRVINGQSASDLLDRTRTRDGATETHKVVAAIVKLLDALTPPEVFYVRMLNDTLPEYTSVERFFRQTVDKFVVELGYQPLQMGIGKNDFAWMNQAIFDSIHHSSIVMVDLTGMRPNCFMELGYALGNKQRVIVTARDDTNVSFDAFALEAFRWNDKEDSASQIVRFRTHWERNINMPNLVRPKEAK
jgi:nucleoside 2-deoxyribosyltransferase